MAAPSRRIGNANRSGPSQASAVLPTVVVDGLTILPDQQYLDFFHEWTKIRDCLAGERVVKSHRELYLRRPSNVNSNDYEGYLARAYFYNATGRTHVGLVGSVMRKPGEYKLPTGLTLDLSSVTIDGHSMEEFVNDIVSELVSVSRFGILTDIPALGETPLGQAPRPHFAGYRAESIYAVRRRMYRGRRIVDRVVLLETEEVPDDIGITTRSVTRILRLDPDPSAPATEPDRLVYSQQISREHEPSVTTVVRVQGRTLSYIPFVIVNPHSLQPTIEEPILSPIVAVNLSHYESTALLEHGRFYAGMPTYFVSGTGASDITQGAGLGTPQPFAIGPSNVWLLEKDDKCGLLEFTGHGLSFLENAVDSKQSQIHSLGGKLISAPKKTAALSSEAYSLLETGDEATLLSVVLQTERALTISLNSAADLANLSSRDALVELNKEFIRSDLTAREVRAIQSLYERKLIPLDVLYYTLRQIGIVPQEYTLEEFKRLLSTPDQLYEDPAFQQQSDLQEEKHQDELELQENEPTPPAPALPAPRSTLRPRGT